MLIARLRSMRLMLPNTSLLDISKSLKQERKAAPLMLLNFLMFIYVIEY